MVELNPHLWFEKGAEEAVRFYTSVVPDSRVESVMTMPADTPSGPEGSVPIIEFTLAGQRFTAFDAGPLDKFNHAVSFMLECDTQAEVDRLWEALGAGGSYEPCGWLRDKYGVSWQIVPKALYRMMRDPDRAKARRVTEAMLQMEKIDLARLEQAYRAAA
jgi:predicted 3-demethylubiquinone-9 3-methyltransferase (glyoxalase superfamily)